MPPVYAAMLPLRHAMPPPLRRCRRCPPDIIYCHADAAEDAIIYVAMPLIAAMLPLLRHLVAICHMIIIHYVRLCHADAAAIIFRHAATLLSIQYAMFTCLLLY